jgi:hypothetical protein
MGNFIKIKMMNQSLFGMVTGWLEMRVWLILIHKKLVKFKIFWLVKLWNVRETNQSLNLYKYLRNFN